MVAIMIIMVGMLGLLQAVNLALNSNRQNQLRNEASLVLDKWLSGELAKGFDHISSSPVGQVEPRPVLNGFANFSVTRKSPATGSNSKEVDIVVSWRYHGTRYAYQGGGVISKNTVQQ